MVMIRSFYISLLDTIEGILLDAPGLAIHKRRIMKSGTTGRPIARLDKLNHARMLHEHRSTYVY
jgi:hypothetical protein